MVATTTLTVMVQAPFTPMVPPASTTAPSPALAVTVAVRRRRCRCTPPWRDGVAATAMPAGSVSVNDVSGIVDSVFGLVRVIVSVTGSPTSAGDGAKVLPPVGDDRKRTASVADAGVALVTVAAPSVAWKPDVVPPGVKPFAGPLAGMVLTQLPDSVEVASSSM